MRRICCFRIILLVALLCITTNVTAQLSTNEKPFSFDREDELVIKQRHANQSVIMPDLDMKKIEQEDYEDKDNKLPPRFGFRHKVNYNLNNSGTWYELPNGDKLWQLEVTCPNALSIGICYDKFWLPEGAKFFTYSKDKKQSLGAFTSRNNKGDREQPRGFATGMIFTSNIVLEYYQPKEIDKDAIISIEYVVHGYRYVNWGILSPGNAGDCMINVNCEDGQDWQDEKKAVAMVAVENFKYCTGSLINTTDFSEAPLFLTANHCVCDLKDAETDPNLDQTIFYWNYETTSCLNDSLNPIYTTSSATILANHSFSDFALLRLSEDPKELPDYTPYYLGWDVTGQAGEPGVCIHHPLGDTKKISFVANQPYPATYIGMAIDENMDHWCITSWETRYNRLGVVERGSSGSPLFNASHKVIGQLHGGMSKCSDGTKGPDWFGRLSCAWYGDDNPYIPNTIYKHLNCWIDSLGTGKETLEGLLVICGVRTYTTNRNLFSNIRIARTGRLTIQSEIEMMGNSIIIVEAGGVLTIDGGIISNADIILKEGAMLRVINGGIIRTRNALKAPVGTIIEVKYGKIE